MMGAVAVAEKRSPAAVPQCRWPAADGGMSRATFRRLASFIEERIGVKVPPSKKPLLEGRLRKRLVFWGFDSYEEYCDFLFSPLGQRQELSEMLHAVTTHKTGFFREPGHFRFLVEEAVPSLMAAGLVSPVGRLLVWSAGCSTGEEAYTLAMVLHEAAMRGKSPLPYVFATDISARVIEEGSLAIYPGESLDPVPARYRFRYFMRSKDKKKRLVRVVPEIRSLVGFRQMNILEDRLETGRPFHVIFCRNVIIYFDKKTQARVVNRLASHLVPGGFLFLGHSETIHGLNAPFYSVGPTIYRKGN